MKYPIGIQDFAKLRENGYVYIDKTALVHKLLSTGNSYVFLSRPRRFGKSLLLSTLHAYFDGRSELFDGLAIGELEKDWIKYPVLHFDLNTGSYSEPDGLKVLLDRQLAYYERVYGADPTASKLQDRFQWIIEQAVKLTGQKVVILVDEYDKPLLSNIGNPDLLEKFRNELKPFFGTLKSYDASIHFAMLTGVTKYSHLNVFSDLNNIRDISMDANYATICGITKDEIYGYFGPQIDEFANDMKISPESMVDKLREMYDGYRFSEEDIKVFNPFSLLSAMQDKKLNSYWAATGTPSYLVDLLKQHRYALSKLDGVRVKALDLTSIDADQKSPVPVIYQSGYLTIKSYDPEFGLFTLGYPNREVSQAFWEYLLPCYSGIPSAETGMTIADIVSDLKKCDIDAFMVRIESLFADTPFSKNKDYEFYYQDILYTVFRLLGLWVDVERHSSKGRSDIVVKTSEYIYVMEFKFNGTAELALKQIIDRGYAEPYRADCRKVVLLGVNFSAENHNLDGYLVEM